MNRYRVDEIIYSDREKALELQRYLNNLSKTEHLVSVVDSKDGVLNKLIVVVETKDSASFDYSVPDADLTSESLPH